LAPWLWSLPRRLLPPLLMPGFLEKGPRPLATINPGRGFFCSQIDVLAFFAEDSIARSNCLVERRVRGARRWSISGSIRLAKLGGQRSAPFAPTIGFAGLFAPWHRSVPYRCPGGPSVANLVVVVCGLGAGAREASRISGHTKGYTALIGVLRPLLELLPTLSPLWTR
jgi:hypothetical protein